MREPATLLAYAYADASMAGLGLRLAPAGDVPAPPGGGRGSVFPASGGRPRCGRMAGKEKDAMGKIALDAEAGQVSAELARRGIAAGTRVHVLVEVVGEESDAPPMAAIAEAGGAFDWLADEPDLYSDADLVRPPPPQRAG